MSKFYLTAVTAIGLALSAPAVADTQTTSGASTQAEAGLSATTETEGGFFSRLGDSVGGLFSADNTVDQEEGDDARGGVLVENAANTPVTTSTNGGMNTESTTSGEGESMDGGMPSEMDARARSSSEIETSAGGSTEGQGAATITNDTMSGAQAGANVDAGTSFDSRAETGTTGGGNAESAPETSGNLGVSGKIEAGNN